MRRRKKRKLKIKSSHLILKARAGTGKTFSCIEGLNRMLNPDFNRKIKGTDQQLEFWDRMSEETFMTVAMISFNKSVADELRTKMPHGVVSSTIHAQGSRTCNRILECKLDEYKTQNILKDSLEEKIDAEIEAAICELVRLAKLTLVHRFHKGKITLDDDAMAGIAEHFNIYWEEEKTKFVYETARKVFIKSFKDEKRIDFQDMIWFPVVKQLDVPNYDLLIVDECQDMSPCQQAFIDMMGSRIICVGDPAQAIYGFAGADINSMTNLETMLANRDTRGVEVLPLTKTRRCPVEVVKLAQQWVPEFEALSDAPLGTITDVNRENLLSVCRDKDFMLCRLNAPLIATAYNMIRNNIKATVRGREIGKGLKALIRKMEPNSVEDLIGKLCEYRERESERLRIRKAPPARLTAMEDKVACVICLTDGSSNLGELRSRIDEIFADETREGVNLSSIHKAKGLEAERVFILAPQLMPFYRATKEWELKQEDHLQYVAVTRTKNELNWVRDPSLSMGGTVA